MQSITIWDSRLTRCRTVCGQRRRFPVTCPVEVLPSSNPHRASSSMVDSCPTRAAGSGSCLRTPSARSRSGHIHCDGPRFDSEEEERVPRKGMSPPNASHAHVVSAFASGGAVVGGPAPRQIGHPMVELAAGVVCECRPRAIFPTGRRGCRLRGGVALGDPPPSYSQHFAVLRLGFSASPLVLQIL